MKTLDVQALHHGIDQTLTQLKQQSQHMKSLESQINQIISLDGALKGEAGESIRAFYAECHIPFLQFFQVTIEEYSAALKKIKNALHAFESNENGFISQSFLEHELDQGLKNAERAVSDIVSDVSSALGKVSHIIDLPSVDESAFQASYQKAWLNISKTIGTLHAFDQEQASALNETKTSIQTMKEYIDTLGTMFTGPKIEITSYQKGFILKDEEDKKISSSISGLNKKIDNPDETPMMVMLKKLNDKERSNVDTVVGNETRQNIHREVKTNDPTLTPLQKEALNRKNRIYGDIRVINDKLYNVKGIKKLKEFDIADEVVTDPSAIDYIGGRYTVYANKQIIRTYIVNGKVRIEEVDNIPESRSNGNAEVLDSAFEGTPLEALGYINLGSASRTLGKKAIKKIEKTLKNEVKDVKKVITERSRSLDLKEHPTKTKQFSSKKMKELKNKIDNRTITKQEYQDYIWNKKFAKKRKAGVTEFWDMEAERIMKGQPTTRNWNEKQVQDILSGKVPKYAGKPMAGHHTYSASKYPHLSDKGEIIYPATFKEHFYGWHGGNWRNSKPGEPIKSIKDF
ncbi:T7SS effector LXG polymorphic toxin [Bacillus altitudinis]|uniref:T7SS effector LXG polymorphic toxin n=1 Tax=Bacillus altitudinis TaxID=293387 RepID=UPI00227E4F20|nr:T7SS effector LXG polymorphic toxin [Bacillus altitudinis]MCY7629254.1 T7SS effector LXG polymorphic toxin [Bacillus altitudinis]MDX2363416.1 T7SS effector LXG polymorphic toxin [Bacillus altitudinis]